MKALVGFAGFGGVDIALRDFDFQVTGIEIDPAIAEVNRSNGGHCLTADLLDIDPADYAGWNLFHFSPPCPSFSMAKSGAAETEDDLALARKICRFIRVGRPEYFTLENVWLYRKSLSWLLIWYTLLEEGYGVDAWNLNAADYGVPQSRRRMIVIARRDGRKPAKPFPTHSKKPDMFTALHRGWYEAIGDLIPDLPEGEFAPWQKDRLPDELKSFGVVRAGDEPMVTVQTRPPERCPHQAFIIDYKDNHFRDKSALTVRNDTDPIFTIIASVNCNRVRAYVVDSGNTNSRNEVTARNADEPIFAITTMAKQADLKMMDSNKGKVISMTPRCLARFQDFPDWFVLPGDRGLACYGIGNAVPPGVYRAVLESLELKIELAWKRLDQTQPALFAMEV